jgi:hypothetical protein
LEPYNAGRQARLEAGAERSEVEAVSRRLHAVVGRGMYEGLCADAWHHSHQLNRSVAPRTPVTVQGLPLTVPPREARPGP